MPWPRKYSTLAFSKARLISVGQRLLTKFIGICICYHYYSEVGKSVRVENVLPSHFVIVRCHARRNTPPYFRQVESYLSHITRNERYNWCGFSEGSVLWTLERWIPHVSVGDTTPERLIAICLTPFSILHGKVSPFRRERWAGRGCRSKLCSLRGLD